MKKLYGHLPGWTERLLLAVGIHVMSFGIASGQSGAAIPYSRVGPLHIDSGTAWIARIFDSKINSRIQIVALGEVSHGGFEPFALKVKMIQYLVERKGYRNVLFELSDFSCMPVRNYLTNRRIKTLAITDSLVKPLRIPPIAASILSALFRWLKLYNLRHPGDMVQIGGFDIPDSHEAFCNYFMYNYIFRYNINSAQIMVNKWISSFATDSTKLRDMFAWFNDHKNLLAASLGKKAFDQLHFHISNEVNGLQDLFRDIRYRDSIMARNVQYLAAGNKTILWAHNAHLYRGAPYMGQDLNQRYQSGYFVLLTDYSKEAAVTVVNNVDRYYYIRSFQPIASSTPLVILNMFGIASGIFFHDEVASRLIADRINAIPLYGEQFLIGSKNAFDALVIFDTITSTLQPGYKK
jgi:hypothetical protein